jgi:predicted nucleic acid-binding protein
MRSQLSTLLPKVWTDAYLVTFAIGHDLELVTIDSDFKNFEKAGLRLQLLTP